MVTTSILLVINKVCGYLDNIRYVDIISVADSKETIPSSQYATDLRCSPDNPPPPCGSRVAGTH